MLKILIIQTLLFYFICVKCQNHFLRILAPEYICNNTTKGETNNLIISFQPKPPVNLTYKVRVFFKTLDAGLLSQRETLLVWKAVRALENKINVLERLSISQENMIEIKPDELFSGISYIFHVTGITDAGETTNEETFTIQYANGKLITNKAKHEMNLQLLGSSMAIPTMDYIVHAKVEYCDAFVPFYVRWVVNYIEENIQEYAETIGTMLQIPSQNFYKETGMLIDAEILDVTTTKLLSKSSIDVSISKVNDKINIIPSSAKIGVNTLLTFQVSRKIDFKDSDTLQISWKVIDAATSSLIFLNNIEGTRVHIKFTTIGRFHVQASIMNAEVALSASSYVIVDQDSPISFKFSYLTSLNPSSEENPFNFKLTVKNFHQSCEAKWESVHEQGFSFIDENEVEKGSFGSIRSVDINRLYLSEIEDVDDDDLIDVDVTLKLPNFKEYFFKKPIYAETSFKFRLTCICLRENEPNLQSSNFFEFILRYHPPPKSGSLQVDPTSGRALTTIFQFNVKGASDLKSNHPLSYELCGLFNEQSLCFEMYFDYKTWETILPYTNKSIEMFANICNARSMCDRTNSVRVSTNYLELEKNEIENLKMQISSAFLRTDYMTALNLAMMTAITMKNTNSKALQPLKPFLEDAIKKEIARLLEKADSKIYFSNEKILKFVKQSRELMQMLQSLRKELIEQLLEIMDQILMEHDRNNDINHQENLSEIEESKILKHDMKRTIISRSFAEIYLLLIQDAWRMESKDQSTNKWLFTIQRLESFTRNMCFNPQLNDKSIEIDLVSIYVQNRKMSEFTKNSIDLSSKFVGVNSTLRLLRKNNKNLENDKEFCLIITRFVKDNFQNQGKPVFGFQIYSDTGNQIWRFENSKTSDSNIVESIAITYPEMNKDYSCLFWITDHWTPKYSKTQNTQKQLTCFYTFTGYYTYSVAKTESPNSAFQTTSTTAFKKPVDNVHFMDTKSSPLPTVGTLTTAFTFASFTTTTTSTTTSTKTETTTTKTTATTPKTTVAVPLQANDHKESYVTALAFALPTSMFIFLLLLLGVGFFAYRRHRSKAGITANPTLKPRQPRDEITYAAIQDIHLMRGSY